MEVTALCVTLYIKVLMLLFAQFHLNSAQDAVPRETPPPSDDSCHAYLILRTTFSIVMVALLLLLLGLLHCGKLRVTQIVTVSHSQAETTATVNKTDESVTEDTEGGVSL
ncbi:hypothetical protein ABVT39_007512 [Epinephelus coioides]